MKFCCFCFRPVRLKQNFTTASLANNLFDLGGIYCRGALYVCERSGMQWNSAISALERSVWSILSLYTASPEDNCSLTLGLPNVGGPKHLCENRYATKFCFSSSDGSSRSKISLHTVFPQITGVWPWGTYCKGQSIICVRSSMQWNSASSALDRSVLSKLSLYTASPKDNWVLPYTYCRGCPSVCVRSGMQWNSDF